VCLCIGTMAGLGLTADLHRYSYYS